GGADGGAYGQPGASRGRGPFRAVNGWAGRQGVGGRGPVYGHDEAGNTGGGVGSPGKGRPLSASARGSDWCPAGASPVIGGHLFPVLADVAGLERQGGHVGAWLGAIDDVAEVESRRGSQNCYGHHVVGETGVH